MPGPLSPQQMQQMQADGFLAVDGYLYLPTYQTSYQGENNEQTAFTGYQQYDARDIGDINNMQGDDALKGRTFGQFDAGGNFLGNEVNTWGGTSSLVQIAPYIMAALATMGVGATIAGVSGAAGAAGAGAAGAMGPITAAEAAAANATLASQLAPYAAGTAGAMGPLTAAETAAQNAALEQQLAQYAVPPAGAPPGSSPQPTLEPYNPDLPTIPSPATPFPSVPPVPPVSPGGSSPSWMPSIPDIVQAGLPLIGSAIQANAAEEAAETQGQAAQDALALYKEMFYKNIELQEPWRQVGVKGINALADRLGISGNTGAEGYGDLTRKFDMNRDYQQDPGYQFRLSEGNKALDRAALARGRYNSGRAYKDIARFNQGEASQEFGNAWNRWNAQNTNTYNRLAGVSGAGQQAATNVGNAATQYGQNAANTTMQAGNVAAAGQVGQANAWMNGISGAMSMYQQNQLMNALLENQRNNQR